MKQEILDLIDIYENEEIYRQRISDAAHKELIPDIAEALNLQSKISFGKNRQRAELLKLNEIFLKELSGIINRLGEKFFKLNEEEFPALALESPETFFTYGDDLISSSDFLKPKIIIHDLIWLEGPNSEPQSIYYLPDTSEISPGEPVFGLEPGNRYEPTFEIDPPKDPYFDGFPLEVVTVSRNDKDFDRIKEPEFLFRCKKKVFERYCIKWIEFLEKWHISCNWDGDLDNLHLHSLPSVIIERDNKYKNLPIVIRLGAWATLNDLKKTWPTVERLMKEARLYRERESDNFIRDLSWYRMNKEEGMSPAKIARFWADKFPKEIDREIIEKITRDDDTFENVDLEDRLKEVLSGDPNLTELRDRFKEERALFLRNGLKEKVKKSIKNLSEKINRFGSEKWDRNQKRLLQRAVPPKDRDKILLAKYPKDYPQDGEK